ncbi:MAG: hypothetical protein CM1200mP34_2660 [Verrucomicrobiales bacterium]|nr:MAG: hypothetical protein CM1200mP34_2660 [Verrucomicrobiales bacterium]
MSFASPASRPSSRPGSGAAATATVPSPKLDQLQMQDSRNNYELESKAERQQQQARQQGERAEQLQTLNRLKELARRQSDLNERVQEFQIALLDAEDEAERERIERELKRLQEEQRELIDDLDEVQQRMESSQDDELAESRRQLEEAREQMEETARTSSAKSFRRLPTPDRVPAETSTRSARITGIKPRASSPRALREMRQDARELDNNQRELNQAIDADREATFRPLSDEGELKEAIDMAESQKEQLRNCCSRWSRFPARPRRRKNCFLRNWRTACAAPGSSPSGSTTTSRTRTCRWKRRSRTVEQDAQQPLRPNR